MSQPATTTRIPSLRFPEFSGEWENYELGQVVQVIDSLHQTPKEYLDIGFPMIRVTDVNNGKLALSLCLMVSENVYLEFTKKYTPKKNDIIMSRVGTCGASVILETEDKVCLGQNTVLLTGSSNQKFLHILITSDFIQDQVNAKVVGSTQKTLSLKDLKKFKVTYPTKEEQTKIAAFLSTVDSKIDQLSQKKTLLEQYKKGVMQQIFSQQIRFKADDGCDYPEWEEKKLGEVGTTYNGLTGKTADDFGDGFPYIQYKQIFDKSKIDVSKFGFVSIGANEKQNMVCYGDIFFTVSPETPNEVGYASVLLDDVDNLYLNSFCFGYRPNKLLLDSSFSQYLFRSNKFRKKVTPLAQGSTRYNISKTEFIKLTLMLPSLEEQTKIANFLTAIDSKIEQVAQQLEAAKQFKKGLLQQMFV